jgi:NADH-quinone oxidoreductase subunit A
MEAPVSGWGEVLIFVIGGLVFAAAALLVARLLRPHRPNPEKNAPYESGEEAKGYASMQLHVRFCMLAILFLIFEVEVVFMLPWATVFADAAWQEQTQGAWGWFALAEMLIFIFVLAVGLAYAWVKGHLDWVKQKPAVADYASPVPRRLYDQINERFKKSV